ncbi:phosphomevalonate kinase [Sorochytrium milnesiophthora]
MSAVAVSAPGKVLIAGGYLVLDRQYAGTVVATDSRFYCIVQQVPGTHTSSTGFINITVRSPQFEDPDRRYSLAWDADVMPKITALSEPNPYIDNAVRLSLVYAAGMLGIDAFAAVLRLGDLVLTVLGDNDFYSQREELAARSLSPSSASLRRLPTFAPAHCVLRNVRKTGLGSSAALVTSLVGALLTLFAPHAPEGDRPQEIHNLAQLCHCAAQGKIGSGFDVSSAVWGTHIYRRFSPSVLETILGKPVESIRFQDLAAVVRPSASWDNVVQHFKLPPGVQLMLGDIACGSNTPSMVSSILRWKRDHATEANALWSQIDQLNGDIERTLTKIGVQHDALGEQYWQVLAKLTALPAAQWPSVAESSPSTLVDLFCTLHTTGSRLRSSLRLLSSQAQVPVEPPEQTKLLDSCLQIPGCITGGVPGAGGYDAVYLLCLQPRDAESTRDRIERMWQQYTELSVCPLLAQASDDGLRVEITPDAKGQEVARKHPKLAPYVQMQ